MHEMQKPGMRNTIFFVNYCTHIKPHEKSPAQSYQERARDLFYITFFHQGMLG
jgi:hypothetical protein